jgi:hypothetical protein
LKIYVYDLEQGKVSSFVNDQNFPGEMSLVEIPLQGWTAEFHLTMRGLEPCAIPQVVRNQGILQNNIIILVDNFLTEVFTLLLRLGFPLPAGRN